MIAYSAAADTNVLVWDATGFGKAGPPIGKPRLASEAAWPPATGAAAAP